MLLSELIHCNILIDNATAADNDELSIGNIYSFTRGMDGFKASFERPIRGATIVRWRQTNMPDDTEPHNEVRFSPTFIANIFGQRPTIYITKYEPAQPDDRNFNKPHTENKPFTETTYCYVCAKLHLRPSPVVRQYIRYVTLNQLNHVTLELHNRMVDELGQAFITMNRFREFYFCRETQTTPPPLNIALPPIYESFKTNSLQEVPNTDDHTDDEWSI